MEPDAVMFLHDTALREYGGTHGLKSVDLLHSALGRPQNRYHYAERGAVDLFDLAAAYAFGIASDHPFNDANKRTAWSCCVLFLKVNALNINVKAPDVVDRMVSLVAGGLDEVTFAAWLREHQV